jgi:hypothetical protein
MRLTSLILVAVTGVPVLARAQATSDTLSLLGRSTISVGFGLTGARSTTAGVGGTSTHTTGQLGAIAFSHWVRPTVAVEISAAALDADATTSGARVHANVVTPILFGVSVSPRSLALSTSIRPYLSAAAGPYIHSVSDEFGASTSASVETVPGARFAAGANWFVSRHFVVGVEGNYHAVGKFDQPDALTEKPSGFGMSMSFGFAWGGP